MSLKERLKEDSLIESKTPVSKIDDNKPVATTTVTMDESAEEACVIFFNNKIFEENKWLFLGQDM